jgi:hypothetical protein
MSDQQKEARLAMARSLGLNTEGLVQFWVHVSPVKARVKAEYLVGNGRGSLEPLLREYSLRLEPLPPEAKP